MLTTLSIFSLEQGKIWREVPSVELTEQPEKKVAPERRPLRTLRLPSLLALLRPARI